MKPDFTDRVIIGCPEKDCLWISEPTPVAFESNATLSYKYHYAQDHMKPPKPLRASESDVLVARIEMFLESEKC